MRIRLHQHEAVGHLLQHHMPWRGRAPETQRKFNLGKEWNNK
jgi:hypothetical protein